MLFSWFNFLQWVQYIFFFLPFCSPGILYSGWFFFFKLWHFYNRRVHLQSHMKFSVSYCPIWLILRLYIDLSSELWCKDLLSPTCPLLLLRNPEYLSIWFSFEATKKFTCYLFRSFEVQSFVHGVLTSKMTYLWIIRFQPLNKMFYSKAHCLSLSLENSTLYCDLCFYFLFSWLF